MPRPGLAHAYPEQLAAFAAARIGELGMTPVGVTLPEDVEAVESALTVAYQVSLLRDEDRPLTFRLALAPPSAFADESGPPRGVHRLVFTSARPFTVFELQKLAPAVKFARSIVGASVEGDHLELWGILHTGTRWLQVVRGGRTPPPEMPSILMVHVNGPGNLVVSIGSRTLARLYGGELTIPMMDVFDSKWLSSLFAQVRDEVEGLYAESAKAAGGWPAADMELVRRLGQSFVRRVISTIRAARHGGTILIVPGEQLQQMCDRGLVEAKYHFADSEPRRRFKTLVMSALRRLAEDHKGDRAVIGWDDYEASSAVAEVDEGILELSQLVSGLADVDGLVVMTQRFEVCGFGGIVSGKLKDVGTVYQALDLEGCCRVQEATQGTGTRHGAAYRIVSALKDALCIVVSQDGGVRFVRWHAGSVTYWDQVAAQTFG
jgi:hypothetical protein